MSYKDVSGPLGGPQPQPTPPPKAQSGDQKITIDYGEANQALVHLEDVWDNLRAASDQVAGILRQGIKAPGHDWHSTGFNGQNDPVVKSVKTTLDKHIKDVEAQYKNLKASLEQYSQNEFGNKGNFDKLK